MNNCKNKYIVLSINRLGKDTDIMKTIGFIGLGLIGGSIAKTIRKFHPDYHILAYAKLCTYFKRYDEKCQIKL